ncbi:type I-E CRISPR-associated protein Cas6/Cse3/CasE [Escherichia coli]
MYLSKVIIARAWSRDLYQLHQGLWHLFPNRPDAARDFLFISERPQYFSGDGKSGKIQTVCFEGVITINDAPALIDLVQQGIGPAKSMGCGLLSLAPL